MYAKVFATLWEGSLCGECDAQLVFIFLLAHADQDGSVRASPHAIGALTGMGADRVIAALTILEREDPHSSSPDEAGARIVRVSAGWIWTITNHAKYSSIQSDIDRRERNREAQQRYRNRLSSSVITRNGASAIVTETLSSTDVDVDVDVDSKPNTLLAEVRDAAVPLTGNGAPPPAAGPTGEGLSVGDWFDTVFWPKYPRQTHRHTARREMLKLFRRLPESDQDELGDTIIAGLERYRAEVESSPSRFISNPATWIRDKRWEDA